MILCKLYTDSEFGSVDEALLDSSEPMKQQAIQLLSQKSIFECNNNVLNIEYDNLKFDNSD